MKKCLFLFVVILLGASACAPAATPQAPFTAGSQTWIDAPLPGSHLPLAAVEIVAHSSSPAGIASFEISLNGQSLASAAPDPDSLDQGFAYARHTWQPTAPGIYLIEVKAIDQTGLPGAPAQVTVTIGDVTPTTAPTETFTPVITPSLAQTATCGPLTFTPNINAYCRQGPGTVFAALDEPAMSGQAYPIDGRNADSTWFRIMLTASQGCWVPSGVGAVAGDRTCLRVLADIPTPSACSVYTDKATCEAQTACQWKLTTAGPGLCMSK